MVITKPLWADVQGRVTVLVALLAFATNALAQTGKDADVSRQKTVAEIVVIGNDPQSDNLLQPQMGVVNLSGDQLFRMPALLGEPDVLKALQAQAGVSGGVEGLTGLLVRGGESDENMYLLHHLPLYHVSHLGGLFSSFNPALIDRTRFFKAGFPAQYGGRISSITDVRLSEGDYEAYHGQASIGLLSGNVFLTGPLVEDKMAFTVGVRRSWADLVTIPVMAIRNSKKKINGEKQKMGYAMMDVNLKLDYKLGDELDGYTHFYSGNDGLKLGEEKFQVQSGPDYSEQNNNKLTWGSMGAATGLSYRTGGILVLQGHAFYSHYTASFRQDRDDSSGTGDERYDQYSHKLSKNGIDDSGASLQADFDLSKQVLLRMGTQYTHHRYRPENLSINSSEGELAVQSSPLVAADEVAAWIDNTFTIGRWMEAAIGARYVYYRSEGLSHQTFEPRANARWAINNSLSLKASYSRSNQFVQQVCNSYISLPTDAWMPIGGQWKPLESDLVSCGVFGSVTEGVYFSVEGYYKLMRNLLEFRESANWQSADNGWADKLTAGKGKAYGADVSLHKDVGRLTGSVSYGLLWNRRQFAELNRGQEFPSKYDNRHKLNINASYMLRENVELNAGWTYMTGNRVTLALFNYRGLTGSDIPDDLAPMDVSEAAWGIDYYDERNNVRLPAYHRLDLAVAFYRHFPSGRQGVWNIGLYNAYSHMNPIVISKDGLEYQHGDGRSWKSTKFQTLGILPVIPSISYTYKF